MSASVDHLYNLDKRFRASDILQPMSLWVPSDRVTLHRIEAPTAPPRKWPSLIPWMLEERILGSVDDMHFVFGARVENGCIDVHAVDRQDMQEWQRVSENAGVAALKMVPDYLVLPWEAGRISVGWYAGRCLVRHSASEGFAAQPELAWAMIERLMEAEKVPPRLSISVPDADSIPSNLRLQAEINQSQPDWEMAEMPASVDLMSGEFKAQQQRSPTRLWPINSALAALVTVLFTAYLYLATAALSAQLAELEDHLRTTFGRVFIGEKAAVEDLRSVASQQLVRLAAQRVSLDSMPLRAVMALGELMTNCDCDLRSLTTDGEQIELEVENAGKMSSRKIVIRGYTLDMQRLGGDADAWRLILTAEAAA